MKKVSIESKLPLADPSDLEFRIQLKLINRALLKYPEEEQKLSSTILEGFQNAMDEMDNFNLNDIDLAYNMLYVGHMTLPNYNFSQFHVIAVTLAKFFVQEFRSLPSSFIRQFNCITNLGYRINCKIF